MSGEFILFLGVGKLTIYVLQKFISDNTKSRFVNNLISCDLCTGVWVYTILAGLLRINVLSDVFPYVPILSEVVVGCVASFAMHLLTLGWKTKFEVVVI